jgi:UDP-glucose 4-epimerase
VVRALVGLLDDDRSIGDVYNVGSTEEISIMDLAKRVRDAASSSSEIQLIPYDQAYETGFEDMRRRVPDTSKLSALTGWAPQHDLDLIIKEVIAEMQRD